MPRDQQAWHSEPSAILVLLRSRLVFSTSVYAPVWHQDEGFQLLAPLGSSRVRAPHCSRASRLHAASSRQRSPSLPFSLSLLRPRTGVESMGSPDHGRPRSPCSQPQLPSVPALGAGVCSSLVPAPLAIAPVHQWGFNRAESPSALGLDLFPSPIGLGPRPLPLGHKESPASQRNRAESPSASALSLFLRPRPLTSSLGLGPRPLSLGHEESSASQKNRAESPSSSALGLFP